MYGPEHQRIRQNVTLTSNGTSSYFAGNTWYLNGEDSLGLTYEKEVRANGTIEHKHYLTAPGLTFAVFTSRTGTLNGLPAATTSYFSHDQLGSISAITNEAGAVTERLAYDPWGKRRFINSTPGLADKLDAIVGIRTDRGYTEHEHLDEMGVIHMNGRIFDPLMGRFMSADPKVTDPYALPSFNRYSYVYNNPLNLTDPTGFDAWSREDSSEENKGRSTYNPTAHGMGNIWGSSSSGGNSEAQTQKTVSGKVVGAVTTILKATWNIPFGLVEGLGNALNPIPGYDPFMNRFMFEYDEDQKLLGETVEFLVPALSLSKLALPQAPAKAAKTVERGSVGAMRRREFEPAGYHGTVDNAVKSKGPLNGQDALDVSVQVKPTSPRRVGVDYDAGEFVVFDRTLNSTYHGHVRSWKDLHPDMQRAFIKSGQVDKHGNIIGGQ